MERCRVLILDGHEMVRVGLRTILSEEEDLEVVGEAFEKEEAILEVRQTQPDVVLMDAEMPGLSTEEICRWIRDISPATKVLVFSANSNDDVIAASLQPGVFGYLRKDVRRVDLLRAVREAYRGASSQGTPNTHEGRQRGAGGTTGPATPRGSLLSRREGEVLDLLAQDLTNRAIATQLYLSEKTVRNHVSHIFRKLGVSGRREAAAYANRAKRTRPPNK